MSFMVSPLNFAELIEADFASARFFDQAFEALRAGLNPQEAGLQNSFSAAVQSWVKRIFWYRVRLIGNINRGARYEGVCHYLDI